MDIILASASPRRAELLRQLGLSFTIRPAQTGEDVPFHHPAALVETLAEKKAAAVLPHAPGATLVLGADTVVILDGKVLGKPASKEEARSMLRALSGRSHEVFTGLALLEKGGEGRRIVLHERTRVHFRPLTQREMDAYVESGEPMDKAGAYGIQALGATFVQGIEGDYFTVVGLPLCRLCLALREFGFFP